MSIKKKTKNTTTTWKNTTCKRKHTTTTANTNNQYGTTALAGILDESPTADTNQASPLSQSSSYCPYCRQEVLMIVTQLLQSRCNR